MKTPYLYSRKDNIWKLISLCEFCIREQCPSRTTELTGGCTEFVADDEGVVAP
jgi:hypothetical protein